MRLIEQAWISRTGSVSRMCRELGVSRTSFYEWLDYEPPPTVIRRAEITESIRELRAKAGGSHIGLRQLTRTLNSRGIDCSVDLVARCVREVNEATQI